jgi:cytochrome c oxidase cbb3-type subunit III
MPAFGEFLGPAKTHLLTAYVWGMGGGVKGEAKPATAEQAGMSGMSGMAGMAADKK